MKKLMFFLVVTSITFSPRLSFASEPFEYLTDVIKSLQFCIIATERIKQNTSNEPFILMKNLKIYSKDMMRAKTAIEGHMQSKNEKIKMAAEVLHMLYSKIITNAEKKIGFTEKILNESTKLKEGTLLRQISEIEADDDDTWRKLLEAVIYCTYSLINYDKKIDDKICCLLITKAERDSLKKQLIAVYGQEVKQGLKTGQYALEASGGAIWQVLNDSWKNQND